MLEPLPPFHSFKSIFWKTKVHKKWVYATDDLAICQVIKNSEHRVVHGSYENVRKS